MKRFLKDHWHPMLTVVLILVVLYLIYGVSGESSVVTHLTNRPPL